MDTYEEQKRNEKHKRMTEAPVERLILAMSVPTIISMLVSSFYNMVDSVYVGHLDNTESSAAVGIAFSIMVLIQAIGFFFGHGSGNYISRELGSKKYDEAEKMAAVGFFTPIGLGAVIAAAGLLFLTPLAKLLGATGTALPYTVDYLKYILIGTPFMMSSLVLNNQLRLQGNAQFAMIGITAGAILNIFLDPIFIFTLGMGVGGAALATIIAQFVSWLLLLIGSMQKGNIHIRFKHFKPTFERYRQITKGGLPSLCRQGLTSVAVIALNWAVKDYGDSAIAAFSIVSKITAFASSALIGFGQGFQPVCGFNYGAGLYQRVKDAFIFCIKVSTIGLIIISILGYLGAPALVALFRSEDPLLLEIGAQTLRYQCLSFSFMGVVILTNMLLQNIGKTLPASLLAMARQGLFFIPALFLLVSLLGLKGAEWAQPAADIASFLLAVPLCLLEIRELNRLAQ